MAACGMPLPDDEEVRRRIIDSHTQQERIDAFREKSRKNENIED